MAADLKARRSRIPSPDRQLSEICFQLRDAIVIATIPIRAQPMTSAARAESRRPRFPHR
jgi:hypothetical protein